MHPRFVDQLERLMDAVEAEERRRAKPDHASASAKLLAAITRLFLDEIPLDPGRREYRQGSTLGEHRKHWFRAKFGGGRFRLFFRFRTDLRLILYVWVNDEETLRTYGSRTDAYAVFSRMLDSGNPPDDWEALLAAARSGETTARVEALTERIGRKNDR
jgi:toxin YhaV